MGACTELKCLQLGMDGDDGEGRSLDARERTRLDGRDELQNERLPTLASSALCFSTTMASSFCSTERAGTPACAGDKARRERSGMDRQNVKA